MSDELLNVLKLCFLALTYLFLARVVRVVVLELRAEKLAPALDASPPPPAAPAPKPTRRDGTTLRIVEPLVRAGESFPFGDEVTVGRAAGCGVVLADDTFVSQVHARLFRRDRDVYVEDLASTNGTFVNGKRIGAATRLERGDRVQFGRTVAEMVR